MKRPIDSPGWEERRLEGRERSKLWRRFVNAFGVLMFLLVVGVSLVGLKMLRKLSKIVEHHKTLMLDADSVHLARSSMQPASMEDSLEKIDLRKATVTGLRGYDSIHIPYVSDRDAIASLLGRADSVTYSGDSCARLRMNRLHYYGRNVIDIDSGGKSIMRSIDLAANPDVKFSAGQFILSRTTTLAGFKRRFPFSADHKLPPGYYGLRPVGRKPGEFLHLTFDKQGRLAYIEYDMGC